MSNFGFFNLRLVNAYNVAFEEARSAVGATDLLRSAQQFESVAEAVADCSFVVGTTSGDNRELRVPLVRIEAGMRQVKAKQETIALLFGSEKFGLGNDDISHCNLLLRIPSREQHPSMNLGQAVAITLYELIRNDDVAIPDVMPHRATAESLQRFENLVSEALQESGYQLSPTSTEKLRRMIRRLEIPPHDAEMWQGMIRQILWKLRHNRE